RTSGYRAHAGGKRCQQRQPRPSVFCHHGSVGGRQGASVAATGNWAACSPRIGDAELRRLETVPALGPASRRSALRKNRRLPRAEITNQPEWLLTSVACCLAVDHSEIHAYPRNPLQRQISPV